MFNYLIPKPLRNRIKSALRARLEVPIPVEKFVPPGHFYSPLPDLSEFSSAEHEAFRTELRELAGIDLNYDGQVSFLNELVPFLKSFPWDPLKPSQSGFRFHFDQDFFREGDALILHSLLRCMKPARIIEVGSGFSSALMLDTVENSENWNPSFTFIEPFPDRLEQLLAMKIVFDVKSKFSVCRT